MQGIGELVGGSQREERVEVGAFQTISARFPYISSISIRFPYGFHRSSRFSNCFLDGFSKTAVPWLIAWLDLGRADARAARSGLET